jgi:rhodanese-related sulfurtransferase
MIIKKSLLGNLMALSLLIVPLSATEVNIQKGVPYVDVDVDGKSVRIERIQDTKHKLTNSYSKTSRPAPPFSIQPFQPIKGIETVSELDVIDFLKNKVAENKGLLLDARMPKWNKAGTIPGATNIPFSILASTKGENEYIEKIFGLLGVNKEKNGWNFDNARMLLIFDNGPWCQQGVRAMKNLLKLGYPKSKMLYYRGGMQYWQILGFTTIIPK